MRIWVIGKEGMLGSSLILAALKRKIDVVGTSHHEANIVQRDALFSQARQLQPAYIINCAAYTDVDKAEKEPEAAFAVNADGAANVAWVARECGARLIHISTDYVFKGDGAQPYTEEAVCAPSNQYGKSKWEGEKRVLEILPNACIVRTSWLFGVKGKNFISSLIHWFQQKEELQVV